MPPILPLKFVKEVLTNIREKKEIGYTLKEKTCYL